MSGGVRIPPPALYIKKHTEGLSVAINNKSSNFFLKNIKNQNVWKKKYNCRFVTILTLYGFEKIG
jgi:hypothetical protein